VICLYAFDLYRSRATVWPCRAKNIRTHTFSHSEAYRKQRIAIREKDCSWTPLRDEERKYKDLRLKAEDGEVNICQPLLDRPVGRHGPFIHLKAPSKHTYH
jgi:hypothetical protein